MLYAVISDIHGNIPAFQAVLNDISTHNVDQVICLGDVVGYGPNPSECIQLIIQEKIPCVKGNHDEFTYRPPIMDLLSGMAQASVGWTTQQLGDDEIDWLKQLPMSFEADGAIFTHASLNSKIEWDYVKDLLSAGDSFDQQTAPLCFVGHTHVPAAYVHKLFPRPLNIYESIKMDADTKYLINAGSVGQPRDKDPRAAYVLWDTETSCINLVRVEYPIEETQKLILATGLPERLATRLGEGK